MRTAYQSIPSTSVYEASASRAFSADLQSPSQSEIPQYPGLSSPVDEKTGYLGLPDSASIPQRLQDQYPALQPVSHQHVMQESMLYQPLDRHHISPKSKAAPDFLKAEKSDQEFRSSDFPINSTFTHPMDRNYPQPGLANSEMNPYRQHALTRYQPPPEFIDSHGFDPPEASHPEPLDYLPLVSQGSDLTLMLPNQKPPATKRGPFKDRKTREKTAHVRKIGSCIRCRMQRIRVSKIDILPHSQLALTIFTSVNLTTSHRMTRMAPVMDARRSWGIPKFIACHVAVGN